MLHFRPQKYVGRMIIGDTVFISIAFSSSEVCRKNKYGGHYNHLFCILVIRGMFKVCLQQTPYSFPLHSRPQRYVESMIIADTIFISIAFLSPEVRQKYDYSRHGSCIAFSSSDICRKYGYSRYGMHFYCFLVPTVMSKA